MLPVEGRHPGVKHFAHHFDYEHLPPHLQVVSRAFHDAATHLLVLVPTDSPDLADALRKLWEAKNTAVMVAVTAAREAQDG